MDSKNEESRTRIVRPSSPSQVKSRTIVSSRGGRVNDVVGRADGPSGRQSSIRTSSGSFRPSRLDETFDSSAHDQRSFSQMTNANSSEMARTTSQCDIPITPNHLFHTANLEVKRGPRLVCLETSRWCATLRIEIRLCFGTGIITPLDQAENCHGWQEGGRSAPSIGTIRKAVQGPEVSEPAGGFW
jgi:hypothetical protein